MSSSACFVTGEHSLPTNADDGYEKCAIVTIVANRQMRVAHTLIELASNTTLAKMWAESLKAQYANLDRSANNKCPRKLVS